MNRHGHSLIEMLVVITVSTTLLGIAVTLLFGLLQMDIAGREHVHYNTVLGSLADQFRQDIHAARTGSDLPNGEGWQFTMATGHTVTYRPEPGGLARVEQTDGSIQRRESYLLSSGATPSIEIPDDEPPSLVTLIVTPKPDATDQPGKQIVRIEAVLARDHRFTTEGNPDE